MGKHDISELRQLQKLPLDEKVKRTQVRIKQWVEHYGIDHVYVSFSGGKDSSVLMDIARKMYPDIKAVFLDTSLEFPELRDFVKRFDNVEYIKPKMNFRQVIEKYGYPVISKEVSECVYGARKYLTSLLQEMNLDRTEHPYSQFYRKICGSGEYARTTNQGGTTTSSEESVDWDAIAKILEQRGMGSGGSVRRLAIMMGILDSNSQIKAIIPSKDRSNYSQVRYKFLLTAPFDISNVCCTVFKKSISHSYNRKNKMHPMLASMACESRLRTQKWLDNGCNGFDLKEPVSNPMAFWNDSDVLLYIKRNGLEIANVYGDIVPDYKGMNQCCGQCSLFEETNLTTTGCLRTGCIACGFGLHLEKSPNRLELIDRVSKPAIRDFILRGGAFDENGLWKPDNRGLGFWFVYSWINVHGGFNIYIPEKERYEKEYGTELTKKLLLA
ncbi:MAG: phosphoadenosine phosphosulfate reductase family protein [Aeriscardovia sp.]|nr:phosphoadenosine phosphosulfate reductase family protein [Aeriscardovia sp.]